MVDINRIRRSFFEKFGVTSFIGDLILLNGCYLIALSLRYDVILDVQMKDIRTHLVLINMLWFTLMLFSKLYILSRTKTIERIIGKNLQQVLVLFVLSFSVSEILQLSTISRLVNAYFSGLFLVAIFLFRLLLIKFVKYRRRLGENTRKVVLVGSNITTKSIAIQLNLDTGAGYDIIGLFNDEHEDIVWQGGHIRWTGNKESLVLFLKSNRVDELFLPMNELKGTEFLQIKTLCEKKLTRMKLVPNLNKFTENHKIGIELLGNLPVFGFIKSPLEYPFSRFIKRSFDVITSIFLFLTVFSWLFPVVAIIIKMSSKGPIFFKQERSGINNRTFVIYKFRSMTVNVDSDRVQATKGDMRITKFGRFMRRTNIDELPQFYNILKGEMSIVGPRPHMLKHTEMYSELISEYSERHYILPGLTGWAQVNGFRGETPQLEMMRQRVEHDIWYIHNWSLLLDLRIIVLTTWNFIRGDANAH